MKKQRLDAIQFLRAFAAIAVVANHSMVALSPKLDGYDALADFAGIIGRFGVDAFFIISGFIMVYTSRSEFELPGASVRFLRRRYLRIVPLYWAMTAFEVAKAFAKGSHMRLAYIICSFFFIPFPSEYGNMSPVHGVGWTLNCEMLFYHLFAIALLFRRMTGLLFVSAILAILVSLNHFFMSNASLAARICSAWSGPVMLYFVVGLVVGLIRIRLEHAGRLLPLSLMQLASAVAIVSLGIFADAYYSHAREQDPSVIFSVGVVLVVVLSALSADKHNDSAIGNFFRQGSNLLGAASYSIYLSHSIITGTIASLFSSRFPVIGVPAFVAASTTICIVVGILVYWYIEQPLLQFSHRLWTSSGSE